ncbi:MAG: hypothetical protein H6740_26345 [Alphaproteobacteria bacterium]|nr:hypothetical protein [Alphaproteobacteria bacterium]
MLGLLITLLTPAASAAADCDALRSSVELRTRIEDAFDAYSKLEIDNFKAAVDEAEGMLPCLSEPLPRTVAATYHRAQGLYHFVERDEEGAQRSFAAARSVEPLYRFPTTLIPEGHPVRVQYGAFPVELGEYLPVPEPAGRVTFDGRDELQRPLSWPTIVQIYDEAGQIIETHYLEPGETMPGYKLKTGQTLQGGVIRRGLEFHPKPTPAMLAGAGGAALVSGGLLALTWRQYTLYNAPETDPADLDALRRNTHTLQVATWVGGGAVVLLGTGAFFVAEW